MKKTVRSVMWAGSLGLAFVLVAAGLTPAEAGQRVDATLATVNAPAFLIVRAESLFAQKVREKTNGGLTINIVASGALGGQKENFEAIMAGNLEMAQFNNAILSSLYPAATLFDLPFVFRDIEHLRRVVRGPIGQQVYGEFEKRTGIKILMAGLPDGPRSVWNRRRPIRTPEDLKGLKIRVMENALMIDTFRALGAIPTPMAYTELYMAAKQGVVDGAETPPYALTDQKAPEVAKYYSLTKHFTSPSGVGVNVKWFTALSPEYKKAILEAADEARAWYDQQFEAVNIAALAEVKQLGMEVNEVEDIEQFRKAVQPVYDKYADQVGGRKMIQAAIDTK
jgi:TRAP-type transport system periplasmic protein